MKVGIVCNVKPQEISDLEVQEEPPGILNLEEENFAEWDKAKTIKAIYNALKKEYEVSIILAQGNIYEKIKNKKLDFVFNIAEGLHGSFRESLVPVLLEELKIPYTGSNPLTLAICLDKERTKAILSHYRIPTPKYKVFYSLEEIEKSNNIILPSVVKPIREGSSMGIHNDSLCFDKNKLKEKVREIFLKFKQPVMVEKFLEGREFTVAILGNYPNLEILPFVETIFSSLPKGANPLYSYEAKWVWDTPEKPLKIFEAPAKINKDLEDKIKKMVVKAIKVLRINDWCRVDIRLDKEGDPYILELNPLPGIIPGEEENSCFPKAAKAAGFSYEELILKVLKIARERYEKGSYFV